GGARCFFCVGPWITCPCEPVGASRTVKASDVPRGVAAAMAVASASGLEADSATVVHESNKLAVRVLPCDVFARVAPVAHQVAQLEVDLAQRLAESESPIASL